MHLLQLVCCWFLVAGFLPWAAGGRPPEEKADMSYQAKVFVEIADACGHGCCNPIGGGACPKPIGIAQVQQVLEEHVRQLLGQAAAARSRSSRLARSKWGRPGCGHPAASSGGRIGEAANPEPLKVLSANCTSIKGAWRKLLAAKPALLILQEVRCSGTELGELARAAGCQVVYGEELEGIVLVAVFAWEGSLAKVSKCPSGQSHHVQWTVGGQKVQVRNGYFQGATAQDKQFLETELTNWLEQAELDGEPTLVAGDFNATRAELEVSGWFEAAGWFELGGTKQPATCLPSIGQPRRLDWLLASRGLQPALRGEAAVRWDLGLKPHAGQEFWVELKEKRRYQKWVPATPLAPLGQAPSYKLEPRTPCSLGLAPSYKQQAGRRPERSLGETPSYKLEPCAPCSLGQAP